MTPKTQVLRYEYDKYNGKAVAPMTKAEAKKVKVGDVLIAKPFDEGFSFRFKVDTIWTEPEADGIHEKIMFKGDVLNCSSGKITFNHKQIARKSA